MDDWSVKIAHCAYLHRVACRRLQRFPIAVDIYQHAALAQVCRVPQASPPGILWLEGQWYDHLRITLSRLYLLRWRKAGVA